MSQENVERVQNVYGLAPSRFLELLDDDVEVVRSTHGRPCAAPACTRQEGISRTLTMYQPAKWRVASVISGDSRVALDGALEAVPRLVLTALRE